MSYCDDIEYKMVKEQTPTRKTSLKIKKTRNLRKAHETRESL